MTTTTKEAQHKILQACFTGSAPSLHMHVYSLLNNKESYLAMMANNVPKKTNKAKIIAALHICKEHKFLQENVLPGCDVNEIYKACAMLDLPRQIRQLQNKIASIEGDHPHLKDENDKQQQPRKKHKKTANDDDEGADGGGGGTSGEKRRYRKRKIDGLRRQLKELQAQGDDLRGGSDDNDDDGPFALAHSDTAVQELIASASVSGALARKIRQWAKTLKPDFLEFVLLTMPLTLWKQLADIVHFSEKDFQLPYFLSAAHGGPLPEGSLAKELKLLVDAPSDQLATKFRTLAEEHPTVFKLYSFLRTHNRILRNREIATALAGNIPVGTAIWYLEELAQSSREIPLLVGNRLQTEDWTQDVNKVTGSFGKLLERILTFQARKWPLADDLMVAAARRLEALKEEWADQRDRGLTVIFGDASSSMQSAIQAATILATMISVCWRGELSFFHSTHQPSPHPRPSTVEQTLEVCRKIRATGCTSLAAALWPYFEAKRKVDRIVLVTDEEENTNWNGRNFAGLLDEYKRTVHGSVELIVVCVGTGDGWFRRSLERHKIQCKRVEIDGERPDLTKFDSLLGQLGMKPNNSPDDAVEPEPEPEQMPDDEFVLV